MDIYNTPGIKVLEEYTSYNANWFCGFFFIIFGLLFLYATYTAYKSLGIHIGTIVLGLLSIAIVGFGIATVADKERENKEDIEHPRMSYRILIDETVTSAFLNEHFYIYDDDDYPVLGVTIKEKK